MTNAVLIQSLISGAFAILGALIAGITLLRVTQANHKSALVLEQRKSKLSKGEDLVVILSELASWRARNDESLLSELAEIESKLNRAYALAITYYGDEEQVSSTFYSEGRELLETIREIIDNDLGAPPGVDREIINGKYLVFAASSRDLIGWILEEMRRVDSGMGLERQS